MSGARSYASLLLLAIGLFAIFMTLGNRSASQRSDAPFAEEPLFQKGHALSTYPTMADIRKSQQRFNEWMENHPCGVLRFTPEIRLLNVTGRVTSETLPVSRDWVFITPNTSFNHSMYVIENCGRFGLVLPGQPHDHLVEFTRVGVVILHRILVADRRAGIDAHIERL